MSFSAAWSAPGKSIEVALELVEMSRVVPRQQPFRRGEVVEELRIARQIEIGPARVFGGDKGEGEAVGGGLWRAGGGELFGSVLVHSGNSGSRAAPVRIRVHAGVTIGCRRRRPKILSERFRKVASAAGGGAAPGSDRTARIVLARRLATDFVVGAFTDLGPLAPPVFLVNPC